MKTPSKLRLLYTPPCCEGFDDECIKRVVFETKAVLYGVATKAAIDADRVEAAEANARAAFGYAARLLGEK